MQGACSLLPSLTHKGVHIGVQYVLNSYLNAGGELQLWEEKNESYITKNTSGIATRVILSWTPLHSPNSQNKGSQSWIKKIESVCWVFLKGRKNKSKDFKVDHCSGGECQDCKRLGTCEISLNCCRCTIHCLIILPWRFRFLFWHWGQWRCQSYRRAQPNEWPRHQIHQVTLSKRLKAEKTWLGFLPKGSTSASHSKGSTHSKELKQSC